MNGLAGYYASTIGKPHEYFDLTESGPSELSASIGVVHQGTWYVMMDPKITPSGQTIVKATALGTIAKHRR